jgi:hypothetical protein
MVELVPIVLAAWLAGAVFAARRWPSYQVVLAVFVLGIMFLPEVQTLSTVPGQPPALSVPGLKLTKRNAMSYAALLVSVLGDRRRWVSFRFRWFDVPMVVWCVVPLGTALTNGLIYEETPPSAPFAAGEQPLLRVGSMLYDGLSQSLDQTLAWGAPYFLGRLYFSDLCHFRFVPIAIYLGGLIYMPLCLIEVMSGPQLHILLYGFFQHDLTQTIRFSGFRPTVFMEHGLEVALWMVAAALLGGWLWQTGCLPRREAGIFRPKYTGWLVFALVATAVLCKSTGALVLGAVGIVVLGTRRWAPAPVALLLLLCAAPLYIGARTTGVWDGESLVDLVKTDVDDDRAQSIDFRFRNENLLLAKAFERPVFGWGGWGKALVNDATGEPETVADGMWIIALSDRGWVGLTALCLAILLPSIRFAWHYRPMLWADPALAPAVGMAVVLALWMVDNLMNAMLNPVFVLGMGGLAGLVGEPVPMASLPDSLPRAYRRAGSTDRVVLTASRHHTPSGESSMVTKDPELRRKDP